MCAGMLDGARPPTRMRTGSVEPAPTWPAGACRETNSTRREAGATVPSAASGGAERHRNDAGRAVGLHAHQHAVLALGLGVLQRLGDVAGIAHCLAADVEDDGADLEAGF